MSGVEGTKDFEVTAEKWATRLAAAAAALVLLALFVIVIGVLTLFAVEVWQTVAEAW